MDWVANKSSGTDSKGSNNSGDSSVLPCIYVWKIEPFSLLKDEKHYNSQQFHAGGFKWVLNLYKRGGVYLWLCLPKSSFPSNSRLRVTCELFLRNRKDKNAHITKQGTFYCTPKQFYCPFMEVLAEKLKDPSAGYVVDNCLECGVEIINVVEESPVKERIQYLRLTEQVKKHEFAWVIKDFSKLTEQTYYSLPSTSWGLTWQLKLHPLGSEHSRNDHVTIYLELQNTNGTLTTLNAEDTFQCDCMIRVVDQIHGKHLEHEGCKAFTKDTYFGWDDFMPRDTIKDSSKGFLVDDNMIIEAKIDIIGSSKIGSH